jgi:hypothetical protein
MENVRKEGMGNIQGGNKRQDRVKNRVQNIRKK